ncbi:hypothetical protein AB0G67_44670 [Streptomyces sp. NPDC021056]|uniref:hypothetical protein n=1 Tax=Streptomyces sp. NPDC021056 TaxID=3155012 RepID=UPI00340491E6
MPQEASSGRQPGVLLDESLRFHLDQALHYIDIARTGTVDSPTQRRRLDTAYGHNRLSVRQLGMMGCPSSAFSAPARAVLSVGG